MKILRSYGFEEELSRKLLVKYNGDLFGVLGEYHTIKKPKDLDVFVSLKGKKSGEKKSVGWRNWWKKCVEGRNWKRI